MKAFGWRFNELNGIWYKEGFKSKDGVWLKYNKQPIVPVRKKRTVDIYDDEAK